MALDLAGRVALVTGASGAIGGAIADELAGRGARLVLHAGTRLQELERWCAERDWRDRALCVAAEIAAPEAVDAMFARAVEHFGRVDVCVACAGIWPAEALRLDELPVDRVRQVVDVNLLGLLWTARSFMRQLGETGARDDEGASLCLIGSTAGRFGEAGHTEYAVTKGALQALMLSLKNEIVQLDPRARVNLVEPGWTVTPMAAPELEREGTLERVTRTMPLRQVATPEDVAHAVAFLSSPTRARHLTGQTLTVAGGMEGRALWD